MTLKKGDVLYKTSVVTISDIEACLDEGQKTELQKKLKLNHVNKDSLGIILTSLSIDLDTILEKISTDSIETVNVIELQLISGTEVAIISDGQKINPKGRVDYCNSIESAKDMLKKSIENIVVTCK